MCQLGPLPGTELHIGVAIASFLCLSISSASEGRWFRNRKQSFGGEDYTRSQLQPGVTNRDGKERAENKAGIEKEQIQARHGASEALARFPAALWPHQHTRGISVEAAG